MPSADAETAEETVVEVDEARQSLLEAVTAELGDAVVAHHLAPNRDVWIRVSPEAWADTATYLRDRQRFRFFDWLSAIDWMPSPFGRSLDAAVTAQADEDAQADDETATEAAEGDPIDKVAGGDTRFQVFARVYNLATHLGLTIKADVGDELSVPSWIDIYPGAAWHEREAHEMFGITFVGNPDMRNLYLPGDFEGHPMRKDFPLMARLVKPWPGIVDVEPMPEVEAPSADNPEATS